MFMTILYLILVCFGVKITYTNLSVAKKCFLNANKSNDVKHKDVYEHFVCVFFVQFIVSIVFTICVSIGFIQYLWEWLV